MMCAKAKTKANAIADWYDAALKLKLKLTLKLKTRFHVRKRPGAVATARQHRGLCYTEISQKKAAVSKRPRKLLLQDGEVFFGNY